MENGMYGPKEFQATGLGVRRCCGSADALPRHLGKPTPIFSFDTMDFVTLTELLHCPNFSLPFHKAGLESMPQQLWGHSELVHQGKGHVLPPLGNLPYPAS